MLLVVVYFLLLVPFLDASMTYVAASDRAESRQFLIIKRNFLCIK